ncbi:MAG: DNA-processing protein DprA [Salibacteraceae bacterium]|nr:DNA-processing protein DprA [Salibacteraceae bacterium]
MEENKIQIHYYEDKNFPRRLLHCHDHPIILYSKGKINANPSRVLSIVGTRRATPYGKEVTQQIIAGLKDLNVLVCSGLAFGIDAEAHQASIKNNLQTIGTVAHGLNMIYPREHVGLAKQMEENGGVISEFISGTIANKENFPRRNRIVAGMSDATLVIESKRRGGALITAYQASGYNRDVFAIPGKVTDVCSEGCNLIIQRNIATMIQSSVDIIKAMGWESTSKGLAPQMEMFIDLSENESQIRNIVTEHQSIRRDELSALIKLSSGEVASTLLSLELKGAIKSLPGGVYTV